MTTPSPSPKSPELSEKSKRYDRQLRLWGDSGQTKLESSKVCLINANATGTEILKSLILPGCGSFTILDNQEVRAEDVGNNYFLDGESLGKNRGEVARQSLLELNRDVSGEAIDDEIGNILKQDPGFFKCFNVVVASGVKESDLLLLSRHLWSDNIPLIYCHVVGLVGWIRVQVREHTIIESHPDSIVEDLRLDAPFPELVEYMDGIELNCREDAVKTPWLVLMYKALEKWRTINMSGGSGGGMEMDNNAAELKMKKNNIDNKSNFSQLSSKDKQEFKSYLRGFLTSLGLHDGDDGFEEALKAVNSSLGKTGVPEVIGKIINDSNVDHPKTSFWLMCSGLRQFVQLNGVLPVRGTIPDMTADSAKYIALQTVYREKALRDSDTVYTYCQPLLQQAGLDKVKTKLDDVRKFCKESINLRLVRGSPIYEELTTSPSLICNELSHNLEENEETDKVYYILFRGLLKFHSEYNTYPGAMGTFESDITRFKSLLSRLLSEWSITSLTSIKDDYTHEIVRYGGSEIPSIAGFVGASVSQEVIKFITSQYVPLDNQLIYNGVNCSCISWREG